MGPWRAEYWAYVRHKQDENGVPTEKVYGWRGYNRPHHHIHKGDCYALEYLAPNLKAANTDSVYPLRMRNVETGDIIMADIL